MSLTLLIHLVGAAIWIGCVLTEAIGEHGGATTPELRRFVSVVHVRWDKWIEVPALIIVAVTGVWMLNETSLDRLLAVKLGFGAAAIIANLFCFRLVLRRLVAARRDDWPEWERLDHLQHKLGAVVFMGLIGALILGAVRLVGS